MLPLGRQLKKISKVGVRIVGFSLCVWSGKNQFLAGCHMRITSLWVLQQTMSLSCRNKCVREEGRRTLQADQGSRVYSKLVLCLALQLFLSQPPVLPSQTDCCANSKSVLFNSYSNLLQQAKPFSRLGNSVQASSGCQM